MDDLVADFALLFDVSTACGLTGLIGLRAWRATRPDVPVEEPDPGLRLVEDCGDEWDDPPERNLSVPMYTICSRPSRRARFRALIEHRFPRLRRT